jgi:peptidoglycan/xylan/chitin deacetylase (PgdA/CDA1 family)
MNISIVMYHYVREIKNSSYPGIKGLEFAGFKRQLDHLAREFTIVTAQDILAHCQHGAPLPPNPCWLTFDDGYKDHIEFVLPELKKRGLQGSFFPPARPIIHGELLDVNAIHYILASCSDSAVLVADLKALARAHGVSNAELDASWEKNAVSSRYDTKEVIFFKRMLQRELPYATRHAITSTLFQKYVGYSESEFAKQLYLSLDDVKALTAHGMYVGNHGYHHNWLNAITAAEQEEEIDKSLDFLASVGAPTKNWIMCYPYGAYNDTTLDILRNKRCALGLTTKVGAASIATEGPLELSRFDTNDFPQ